MVLTSLLCPDFLRQFIAPAGERLNFFIRGEGSEYAAMASAAVQDAETLMAYVPRRRRAGGHHGGRVFFPRAFGLLVVRMRLRPLLPCRTREALMAYNAGAV